MKTTIQIVEISGKKYKVSNGTFYHEDTDNQVIEVLERAREGCTRLLLDYGDTKTGKSWGEVNDIKGYVGRSTGSIKIPLLLYNTRSMGGGAILTDCILKITRSNDKNRILYQLNS